MHKREIVTLWTVAIGNLPGPLASRRKKRDAETALKLASEQEGFVGVHPCPPNGTVLLYLTENDAKRARNVMVAEGVVCGKNICSVRAWGDAVEKRLKENKR